MDVGAAVKHHDERMLRCRSHAHGLGEKTFYIEAIVVASEGERFDFSESFPRQKVMVQIRELPRGSGRGFEVELRIIVRHIMPMCIPSVVVRITLNMTGIILTAAGLGFLGLGAQPPTPEWGAMLSTGREYMLGSWWIAAVPGLAILIVGLAFSLFGDGLRDVLDPRHD